MIKSNDFITIGTEEEIRGFQRKLDFSDDRIGMYYSALHPAYQDCVCEVIGDLIAGQDFFGYNFSQFLKSNKKAVTSVSQLLIIVQNILQKKNLKFFNIPEMNFNSTNNLIVQKRHKY